jgi:hypothetical protein
MEQQDQAITVIESLRTGLPPNLGVELYSVGNEKLIDGIKRYHISGIKNRGTIRFINGSWGAGKTHFFRLLREVAFKSDCLVSNVELNANDAALNKFEKIFFTIVRNIATPTYYTLGGKYDVTPFGNVLRESLGFLSTGNRAIGDEIVLEQYTKANERLFTDHSIDIDFKKMVQKYWETFIPESAQPETRDQLRAEILQWFSGEGKLPDYRKKFGVNKMVSKDNAKVMFQSLAGFVRLSGYQGLLIEFDEAEMAYSTMRKAALRDAHNNLLSLINNIEMIPGLFLIYATTPDFFNDPKHGITIYGALAGRIGKPESHPPKALDKIWNFDEVTTSLEDYQSAAIKIRNIYANAYPEAKEKLPDDTKTKEFVARLNNEHPSMSPVRFWRVMVTGLISYFDDIMEGETRTPEKLYYDVMDKLREA